MQCPQCQAPIALPAPPWRSQWPPYVCGQCGAHWGARLCGQPFLVPPDVEPLFPLMSWQQAAKWAQGNGLRPYVYAICYPNGLPFYIGKGRRQRLMQHAAFLRLTDLWANVKRPRDEKEAVIWQLALNRDYERYAILAICETDYEAFGLEAVAIDRYGRRERGGLLCNATVATQAPPWPMPAMPDVGDARTDGEFLWNLAPELNSRGVQVGKAVWCPKCDNPGMCARSAHVRELRCPVCFHYFELVDEWKLRKWLPSGFVSDRSMEIRQPGRAACS